MTSKKPSIKKRGRIREDEIQFRSSLATVVLNRRKESALTQQDIAEKANVHLTKISQIETEAGTALPDTMIRIMQAMKLSLSDFGVQIPNVQDQPKPRKINLATITREDFREVFAKMMVERRKAVGMSQADLAARLETNQAAVSRWEHEEDIPGSMMFIRIMQVLEFDPFGIATKKR